MNNILDGLKQHFNISSTFFSRNRDSTVIMSGGIQAGGENDERNGQNPNGSFLIPYESDGNQDLTVIMSGGIQAGEQGGRIGQNGSFVAVTNDTRSEDAMNRNWTGLSSIEDKNEEGSLHVRI
jgi:hypothetical protein